MEETVENKKVRNEASQKALKAILGLTAITIVGITYGIVMFAMNLNTL